MQSSQSRIKSRKILGVGEGADGQLHSSKISQILGNDSPANWQIARAEYPVGLQALQWITCLWFSAIGLASLLFPKYLLPEEYFKIKVLSEETSGSQNALIQQMQLSLVAGTRLYGAAVVALASLCIVVTAGNWQSRRAIRIVLLVVGIFCLSELLATFLSGTTHWKQVYCPSAFLNGGRIFVSIASFYYFKQTANNTPLCLTKRASE